MLIAHYKLDGNAQDSSGNNNHGVENSIQWLNEGPLGYSAEFTQNSHIEIPSSVYNIEKQEITIAFWLNGGNNLPENTTILSAKGVNDVRTITIHIPYGDSNIYWDCGNDGSSYDRIHGLASDNEFKNNWSHWTFTKNVSSGIMRIYKNGQIWLEGFKKHNPMIEVSEPLDINSSWYGKLSDVRFYNHELDKDEVKLLYDNMPLSKMMENYISNNKIIHYTFDNAPKGFIRQASKPDSIVGSPFSVGTGEDDSYFSDYISGGGWDTSSWYRYDFYIPITGSYSVRAFIRAWGGSNDSFFMSIDGESFDDWHTGSWSTSEYRWRGWRTQTLSEGWHYLRIAPREQTNMSAIGLFNDEDNGFDNKPSENLLPIELQEMSGIAGWDENFHPAYSASFIQDYDGRKHVYKLNHDGSDRDDWYSRVTLNPTSVGDVFIFSREYKVTVGNDKPNNPIFYQDGWKNGGSATKNFLFDIDIGRGWRKIAHKFTVTTAGTPVLRMSTGYTSNAWEVYMDNYKLEKSNHYTYFSYDKSNGIVFDKSGRNNHGILPLSTPLFVGDSYKFDDSFIQTKFGNGLNVKNNKLTITFWAKPDNISSSQMVLSFGTNTDNRRAYFSIYNSNWDQGIQDSAWQNGSIPVTKDWTFVSIVFNGISSIMKINMQTTSQKNYSEYLLLDDLRIGQYGNGQYPFYGEISDFRVYNTSLSDDQLNYVYNKKQFVFDNKNSWTYSASSGSTTKLYNNGHLEYGPKFNKNIIEGL